MEIKFAVTKEGRKALVKTVGEIIGWAPVYKGAPSFAFAVNNYIIDRDGTLIYDERTSEEDVRRLLAELSARGFMCEVGSVSRPTADTESDDACVFHAPISGDASGAGEPAKKTIIVDMPFFNDTALDNLRKLIGGKAALIRKAIGADDLTVAVIGGALHFNWFHPKFTERELDAYKQFVTALCITAKNQKRVTMKESAVESEKFAFRCFLLKLGFIGEEFASARKVLLARLSGNSSFKSDDHTTRRPRSGPTAADSGGENHTMPAVRYDAETSTIAVSAAVPARCGECPYHCYYTDGQLCSDAGDIVDTSNRAPDSYTHYCLNAPSGYRKLKHATAWSGFEPVPKWCPLRTAEANVIREEADNAATLAETLADAEFIHSVNMLFEAEGGI